MKVDYKELTILILTMLCIMLFGVAFELGREVESVAVDYEYELYKTKEHLDVVKDELGKAKHHIWMMNKEREAE